MKHFSLDSFKDRFRWEKTKPIQKGQWHNCFQGPQQNETMEGIIFSMWYRVNPAHNLI